MGKRKVLIYNGLWAGLVAGLEFIVRPARNRCWL